MQAKFTEFKIQNIVGSCDVKFPIRLEKLAFAHGQASPIPCSQRGSSLATLLGHGEE